MSIVWDIETGPGGTREEIVAKFNRDSVKLGNLSDPEKIERKYHDAEEKYYQSAALSPLTGKVFAVGFRVIRTSELPTLLTIADGIDIDEACILENAWRMMEETIDEPWCGWNTHNFDLPFLLRRSIILGIDWPSELFDGRWFHDSFVDLMKVWAAGERGCYESLDTVARACGHKGKQGSTGKDFARLLFEDRDKATNYLINDLAMTEHVARRCGF